MSVFFGNRFIAFTPSDRLNEACVYLVSLMPGASDNELILPLTGENECLKDFPAFKSEAEAIRRVKTFLLDATEQPILELVVAVESQKLQIERRRMLTPQSELRDKQLEWERSDLDRMSEELKQLRMLRRKRVKVLVPTDSSAAPADVQWVGNGG